MHSIRRKNAENYMLLKLIMARTVVLLSVAIAIIWLIEKSRLGRNRRRRSFSLLDKIPDQIRNMSDLTQVCDEDCKNMLRMDRVSFVRLCNLLQTLGGLTNSKYVTVQEKVAMFLNILAHHTKNRSVTFQFKRSGQTVSKYFRSVLHSVLKLGHLLLVQPQPIPVDSTDSRWGKFEGCLGALDGTYIDLQVPAIDKPRYRNRKGQVTVNVLGVCDMAMKFVYVLTGWEGSAADSRVLRDAINRPHGLRVPKMSHATPEHEIICSKMLYRLRSA